MSTHEQQTNSDEQLSTLQPHYFLALDVSFMTVLCKNHMQLLEQRCSFWNTDSRLLWNYTSVGLKLSSCAFVRCSRNQRTDIPMLCGVLANENT